MQGVSKELAMALQMLLCGKCYYKCLHLKAYKLSIVQHFERL
jgi:hypothetical protein